MDHILDQVFKIISSKLLKKNKRMGDNPAIRININAIENTIAFKIKTECYLKILTPKTMKLLGST